MLSQKVKTQLGFWSCLGPFLTGLFLVIGKPMALAAPQMRCPKVHKPMAKMKAETSVLKKPLTEHEKMVQILTIAMASGEPSTPNFKYESQSQNGFELHVGPYPEALLPKEVPAQERTGKVYVILVIGEAFFPNSFYSRLRRDMEASLPKMEERLNKALQEAASELGLPWKEYVPMKSWRFDQDNGQHYRTSEIAVDFWIEARHLSPDLLQRTLEKLLE